MANIFENWVFFGCGFGPWFVAWCDHVEQKHSKHENICLECIVGAIDKDFWRCDFVKGPHLGFVVAYFAFVIEIDLHIVVCIYDHMLKCNKAN